MLESSLKKTLIVNAPVFNQSSQLCRINLDPGLIIGLFLTKFFAANFCKAPFSKTNSHFKPAMSEPANVSTQPKPTPPKMSFSSIVATGTQPTSPSSTVHIETQIISNDVKGKQGRNQEFRKDNRPPRYTSSSNSRNSSNEPSASRINPKKFTSAAASREQNSNVVSTTGLTSNDSALRLKEPLKVDDAAWIQETKEIHAPFQVQDVVQPVVSNVKDSIDLKELEGTHTLPVNEENSQASPAKIATSNQPQQSAHHRVARSFNTVGYSGGASYMPYQPVIFPGGPMGHPYSIYPPFPQPGMTFAPAYYDPNFRPPSPYVMPVPTTQSDIPKIPIIPQPKKVVKIINPLTMQEVKPERVEASKKDKVVVEKDNVAVEKDKVTVEKDKVVSEPKTVDKNEAHGHAKVENVVEEAVKSSVSTNQVPDSVTIVSDVEESAFSSDHEIEDLGKDYILQHGQQAFYPDGVIDFVTPAEDEPWRYSKSFLIQFQPICNHTNMEMRKKLLERFEQSDKTRDHRHSISRDDRAGKSHYAKDRRESSDLPNRSEDAYVPGASKIKASKADLIVREVRGILNKMTEETFDILSDQIISLRIISSSEALQGVISCVFDKAVEEPHFCPMYARLCVKIVRMEADERKQAAINQGLPAPQHPTSVFRNLLLKRCQEEYSKKRAWSKERLEKLLKEKSGDENAQLEIKGDDDRKPEDKGHLTDDDFLLIKLKRRVLGNVHFIGELFKTNLLSNRIMHECVQELLSNVENPEEEEIESLCRLLHTVGYLIDTADAAESWQVYMSKMRQLSQSKTKLKPRVRFMVDDVIEERMKGWKSSFSKSQKSLESIRQEQIQEKRQQEVRQIDRNRPNQSRQSSQTNYSNHSDVYRGSSEKYNFSANFSQSELRGTEGSSSGRPGRSFLTAKSQTSSLSSTNEGSGWNTIASGGKKSSVTIAQRQPATPQASSPVPSINRFVALESEEPKFLTPVTQSPTQEKNADFKSSIRRVAAIFDEYVKSSDYKDVVEESLEIPSEQHEKLFISLIEHCIEKGKTHVLKFASYLSPLYYAKVPGRCFDTASLESALNQIFADINDLSIDVPEAPEYSKLLHSVLDELKSA